MNTMQENKLLANDILERHYYQYFRSNTDRTKDFRNLEVFLTGACRSNCEYCYLKKHMKDLYPLELQNYKTIIKNFELIIQWYIDNKFNCNLEIFSAEWLTTPLAEEVINIIYDKFKNTEYKPPVVLAADNMQFLKDKEITNKVKSYIEKLASIDIKFALSASVDGKYCDFGRTENSDEFYKNLHSFLEEQHFLPHPMLSANNSAHWIDNFKWWKEEFGIDIAYNMTLLEVRNQDWNEDSINNLIKFCDFLVDETFKELNYDKEEMVKYVFRFPGIKNKTFESDAYNPIRLTNNHFTRNFDIISCSFGRNLSIRVGDLSVAPCHRLYYPLLELGKFNVVDDKIIDFEPTNVSLLAGKQYMKRSCMPICEHCGLVGICPGFCLGASYEEYRNMMVPQMEVCEMYRAKYSFLIYKYSLMGLFDDFSIIEKYTTKETARYLQDLIKSIIEEIEL